MTAVSVTFWARRFLVLQVAIAAGWDSESCFSRHSWWRCPPPQLASRLSAVHPHMAKTLTIVALCKPVLGSVSLDSYKNVTDCCQFENFWSFLIPCYRK
jgi:hypothetical protein